MPELRTSILLDLIGRPLDLRLANLLLFLNTFFRRFYLKFRGKRLTLIVGVDILFQCVIGFELLLLDIAHLVHLLLGLWLLISFVDDLSVSSFGRSLGRDLVNLSLICRLVARFGLALAHLFCLIPKFRPIVGVGGTG